MLVFKRIVVSFVILFLSSNIYAFNSGKVITHTTIPDQKAIYSKRQKIVRLKSKYFKKRIKNFINKYAVNIIAEGRSFLVIRPQKKASEKKYHQFLNLLKKRPGILSIEKDQILMPLQVKSDDNCIDCMEKITDGSLYPRTRSMMKDSKKVIKKLNKCKIKKATKCYLTDPHCRKGRNPAWAKLQIGADLAEEIVEEEFAQKGVDNNDKSKVAATVAVVDTGFDYKNQRSGINSLSFTVEKGHISSGQPDIDPGGHGTPVSGMISGRGVGVTKNVNLRFYRITEQRGGGSVSGGLLAASIEKACEKSDIVNVSWGSFWDEIGSSKVENSLWYKTAADRGCLIIKSAGNRGIRRKLNKLPIDAPFLSVAASGEFETEASFSTTGMIVGPGEGVYTLLSHQHKYSKNTNKNKCKIGGNRIGPVNGTSFSAPATAGVAGQVLTILKTRGIVPKSPKKKIALIKSILLASTKMRERDKHQKGLVNALGAALIAKGIIKDNMTNNIDKLVAIGRKMAQKRCQKKDQDCRKLADCTKKRKCTNDLRFKIQACTPLDKKTSQLLFDSYNDLKEMELTTSLLSLVPPGHLNRNKIMKAYRDRWKSNLDKDGYVDDPYIAKNILRMAQKENLKEFITKKRVKQLIKSSSFLIEFSIDEIKDPKRQLDAKDLLQIEFVRIFQSLSPKDQIEIISKIPQTLKATWFPAFQAILIDGQIGIIYKLNKKIKSLPNEVQKVLKKKILKLAQQWFLGELYTSISDASSYAHRNTPVFDMFLEVLPQGKEKFKKRLQNLFNLKNHHLYIYSLTSKIALTPQERGMLAKKIIRNKSIRNNSLYKTLLEKALKERIKNIKSDQDKKDLEDFLIESKIPIFLPSDITKIISLQSTFWGKYISTNMKRNKEILVGNEKLSIFENSIYLMNIMSAFEYGNSTHLIKENYIPFKKLLTNAVNIQLKSKKNKLDYSTEEIIKSTIFESFDNLNFWEKHGLENDLKLCFRPIFNDVLIRPDKYDEEERSKIYKFLNIDENIDLKKLSKTVIFLKTCSPSKQKEIVREVTKQGRKSIPYIIESLKFFHPTVTPCAIKALKKFQPISKNYIPNLISTLIYDNQEIKNILLSMGEEAVPFLIKGLGSNNNQIRLTSSEILKSIDKNNTLTKTLKNLNKEYLPHLVKSLESDNRSVKDTAIYILEIIGPRSIPALTKELKGLFGNQKVKLAAIKALGKMGDKAIPALAEVLNGFFTDQKIQLAAIKALEKMGDKAIPALTEVLNTFWTDQKVKQAAIKALGKMRGKAIPTLKKAPIKNKKSDKVILQKAETKEIPALIKMLGSHKDNVRKAAISSLKKRGTKAIPILIKTFKSQDENTQKAIIIFLENMGDKAIPELKRLGKYLAPYLATFFSSNNKNLRNAASSLMFKIGKKAIPTLVKALTNKNSDISKTAITILQKMGDKAIPALTEALGGSFNDPKVKLAAIKGLEKMGDKAIPALTKALESIFNKPKVKLAAIKALGKMGDKAIPGLTKALEDFFTDPKVKLAAIKALEKIGDKAILTLAKVFKGINNQKVKLAAIKALGKMGDKAIPVSSEEITKSLLRELRMGNLEVKFHTVEALRKLGASDEIFHGIVQQFKTFDRIAMTRFISYVYDRSEFSTVIKDDKNISKEDHFHLLKIIGDHYIQNDDDERKILVMTALFNYMQDKDEDIRDEANEILQELDYFAPKDIINTIASLKNGNRDTRISMANSLSEVEVTPIEEDNGIFIAIYALTKAIKDEDAEVRLESMRSLFTLLERLRENYLEHPLLSYIYSTVTSALIESLKDNSEMVRVMAVRSLEKLGNYATEAIPALTAALKDSNKWVRLNAKRAIEAIRNESE